MVFREYVEKARGLAGYIWSRLQEPRAIDYLGSVLGGYAVTKWNIKENAKGSITVENPVGFTRLAVLGGGLIAAEMFDFPGLRGAVMGAIGSTITTAELWRIATGEYPSPFAKRVTFTTGAGEVRVALPPGFRREWLRVSPK